ncbi:MAG: acetyl-CoA C-acyltransferase [Flavobacteriaceae bacterium]|nr:acetyl-CoA C-acyltransferase [Flavobacteriaceae bacterium]|tara:strand:+ start:128 stop:1303 length:1176 start_codon:yes stop_codon:yes gene_type:complete
MQNKVVVVSAVRTPLGCFMGSLSNLSAVDLGISALKGALSKINLDKNLINELIIGHVLQSGCGQAPAKQIAMSLELDSNIPCSSINKVCSSGMKAVSLAAQSIQLGLNDVVVAGGIESMSNAPHYINLRKPKKYGNAIFTDGLMMDGLTDVYSENSMGVLADNCSTKYKISRELQDEYTVLSYNRSIKSIKKGFFKNEIVPVEYTDRKGNKVIVDTDEQISKVNFDKISKLNPAFVKNGTITAANSSPISDGASILILMNKQKAIDLNIKSLAEIVGFADSATKPDLFTIAPSNAIDKLTKMTSTNISQVDLFEINEAFSMVPIVNIDILNLDKEKVNINGGAVSLGHPLGCSGARIITTLIHSLHNTNKKTGIAAICNGGGGASSIQIKI